MPEIPQELLDAQWIETEQIINNAVPLHEIGQSGQFPQDIWRFISREGERHFYKPKLPYGGSREEKDAKLLREIARTYPGEAGKAIWMANEKDKTKGCYYVNQPLAKGDKKAQEECDYYNAMRERARRSQQWKLAQFAQIMIDGPPKIIANFHLECKYVLLKADGSRVRLVKLRNCHGEVSEKLCELPVEATASPTRCREWAQNQGNFSWGTGQEALDFLSFDISHAGAFRTATEVVTLGWFPITKEGDTPGIEIQEGIFFFSDMAIGPDGSELFRDDDGIVWYGDNALLLSKRGAEAEFMLGDVKVYPKANILNAGLPMLHPAEFGEEEPPSTETEALRLFTREIVTRLNDSVGGMEGQMMFGSMISYAVGPEIFGKYQQFPGLWIHGQAKGGKSTMSRWLVRMWGFEIAAGIAISRNATAVGMQMASAQYSFLPIWFDEYRRHLVDEQKTAILRSYFDRSLNAKWSADGNSRKMRTSPLVSGESTSGDAATRSRYPHALIAASLRRANHVEWMTAHRPFFFLFGRTAVKQRKFLAPLVLEILEEWVSLPMGDINEREKLVHGVAFASFAAWAKLTHSYSADEITKFKEFMMTYAIRAEADVNAELNVTVWFEDVATLFLGGSLDRKYWKVRTSIVDHPPDAPNQGRWHNYQLIFYPQGVIDNMKIHLAKRRDVMALNAKDLHDQLSKNAYWVEGKQHRVPAGNLWCWVIDLDKHPLGYQKVSDADYEAFIADPSASDPRKGQLFAIVEKLKEDERPAE